MIRSLILLMVFLSTVPLIAQARIDAGLALGQQGYQPSSGTTSVMLPSVEILIRRDPFNAQLALESADLPIQGALLTLHANATCRLPLGEHVALLISAGPTYLNADRETEFTWNAAVELAYHWTNVEVFARARRFDYTFPEFQNDTSPDGPAIYVGARYRLRG